MLVNRCSVLNKICSTIWHIENQFDYTDWYYGDIIY